MKKHIVFVLFLQSTIVAQLYAQTFTVNGYVRNARNGEALINASLYIPSLKIGTTTNQYGFFSLTAKQGNHRLLVSYIGFTTHEVSIELLQNLAMNFELEPSATELGEISVEATPFETSVQRLNLKIADFKKLPAVFGELDIVKGLQLQTGVKTMGDGSGGLFVRGGGTDQNLVLMDEAPIYNPSHFFGLVSVFNPDAVNNVTFYKGYVPSKYGGRMSSVIDVKQNEGNLKEYKLSGGISPFAARLTYQGPIIPERTSFFVAARKSLFDLVAKAGDGVYFVPSFYDFNAKLNHTFDDQSRLLISLYKGEDGLASFGGLNNKWGNTTTTLRYHRPLWERGFLTASVIYSSYNNDFKVDSKQTGFAWQTGVEDINAKLDFAWFISDKLIVNFGGNSILHQFVPGSSGDPTTSIPDKGAIESAAYADAEYQINNSIHLTAGLRWSGFASTGKEFSYLYDENGNISGANAIGNSVRTYYFGIEPRLNLSIDLNANQNITAGYSRNYQYFQLLVNTPLAYSSLDSWFPTNSNIAPLSGDILTLGWFLAADAKTSFSIEGYYKLLENQIDFVDHAKILNNSYVEQELAVGLGKAYGVEMEARRSMGAFSGTVSCTWSRSLRKITEINGAEWYSAPFDLPLDFRLTTNYQTQKRWEFSAVWLLMSGRPFTVPIGYVNQGWYNVPVYSERNGARLPDYHRMDISATLHPKPTDKKFKGTLVLGVYNLYARQNPLAYQFSFETFQSAPTMSQFSFVRILPNISYNFNF